MRYRNASDNMSTIPQPANRVPTGRYSFVLAMGLLSAATLIGAGAASGQNFDCRKARSADEMTICQESGLAKLDQELASLKRQRKEKHHKAERDEADDNETPFLNARRRCGENHACIEQSYRNRIRELTQAVPDEDPERPGRHADSKRSDRQKAVKRDGGKTEDQRTEAEDAKRGATETAIASPGRTTDQTETGPVSGLPPEVETRPRHHSKRDATTAVAAPPAADREVQPSDASAAPVGQQRSGAHGSGGEMTGSEPPKQQSKRGAPGTAHTADRPPTIRWVDPPPAR
jgi:uncharacterized protein